MRTTVRIDDELLVRAKAYAAQRRRSLTSVVEEGLLRVVTPASEDQKGYATLPVSSAAGGLRPGIDLDDSATLLDVMDDVAS